MDLFFGGIMLNEQRHPASHTFRAEVGALIGVFRRMERIFRFPPFDARALMLQAHARERREAAEQRAWALG
jgi:hypothetical protein